MSNWLTSRYRVSVNRGLINKNELGDTRSFAEGWENCELTPGELAEFISNGVAYCAELHGPRRGSNFSATGFLSVDIDGSRRLVDAVHDPFINQHATIIYTTRNHTEEENRFRIVFALEEPIVDANEMRLATRSLALRLGGDPAVADPSRLFFGNRGCSISLYANGLSAAQVKELIVQSKGVEDADSPAIRDAPTSTAPF